jgi:glycogen synthase
VGAPSPELFRHILERACAREGLVLTDDILSVIVRKITEEKGLDLAAYQPKFIVDQVVATCRFLGQPPHFETRFLEYAVDNLRVSRK